MEKQFKELVAKQKKEASEEGLKDIFKVLNQMPLYIAYNEDKEILIGKTQSGQAILPIMTSEAECETLNAHTCRRLNFTALKQIILLPNSQFIGLTINPNSDNLIIEKEGIQYMDQLLTGMTQERTDPTSSLSLKPVERIWPVIRREVAAFGMLYDNIEQINLLNAKREDEEDYHPIFIVSFKGRDVDLFPKLAERIRLIARPGTAFELLQWHEKPEDIPFNEESLLYKKGLFKI